jgi:polar amino acid transport system substrate-binding protein
LQREKNFNKGFDMRFGLALLILYLLSVPVARADTFRISTAEFPEAKSIARLLKEVYQQIGHDFELVFRPAKRSLAEVNSGQSDAELARIIGTEVEYPNLVRVEEPVFAISFSAIVKSTSKTWLSSWRELEKHSIGYPRGYRILDIRTRNMNAVQVSDSSSIVNMVKGGRFEVGIMISSEAARLASITDGIEVLTPPIEAVTLYHYLGSGPINIFPGAIG